jgi:hypothetical protein
VLGEEQANFFEAHLKSGKGGATISKEDFQKLVEALKKNAEAVGPGDTRAGRQSEIDSMQKQNQLFSDSVKGFSTAVDRLLHDSGGGQSLLPAGTDPVNQSTRE